MIAVDALTEAVMDALSSGYCPSSKTYFLLRLLAAVSVLCAIGVALLAARPRSQSSTVRCIACTGAAVLILFALGGAAWDTFGLSGCGNRTTAGLTWEWPW